MAMLHLGWTGLHLPLIVASVQARGHVLPYRTDGLTRLDFASDRGLDGNLEELSRYNFLCKDRQPCRDEFTETSPKWDWDRNALSFFVQILPTLAMFNL